MKVYHRVPVPFIGPYLYPLNALKTTLPRVYTREVVKYRGRTTQMQRVIPYLHCLWNDTLHFSTVHPGLIREAVQGAGFDWEPRDWFEIDPQQIAMHQGNAVIYTQPARATNDSRMSDEDFIPFTLEALEMLNSIPKETVEYFNYAKVHEERPFLFNFIPHVLYRGAIHVEGTGVERFML